MVVLSSRDEWGEAGVSSFLAPFLAGKLPAGGVELESTPWFDNPPKSTRAKTSGHSSEVSYLSFTCAVASCGQRVMLKSG